MMLTPRTYPPLFIPLDKATRTMRTRLIIMQSVKHYVTREVKLKDIALFALVQQRHVKQSVIFP